MNIHTCSGCRLGFPDTWNWDQQRVSGPYWRAYWNDSPGAFVRVGAREASLGPNRVVLLAPRTVYSSRTESGVWHLYLHFSVDRPFSEVRPGLHTFTASPLVRRAAEIARDVRSEKSMPRTLLKTQALLCDLLLALPEREIPSQRAIDPRIATAQRRLESGPAHSNLELARMASMSRTAFSVLFRHQTGTTPQSYSRRNRLERACVRLHFSADSIETIAESAGFCDRYHFERAFKREFGLTPAKYRRQGELFR